MGVLFDGVDGIVAFLWGKAEEFVHFLGVMGHANPGWSSIRKFRDLPDHLEAPGEKMTKAFQICPPFQEGIDQVEPTTEPMNNCPGKTVVEEP